MMINIDRLVDITIECMDSRREYDYLSRKYYKEHGYGVRIDLAKTDEEKHIAYLYHRDIADSEKMWAIMDVLDINGEMSNRLYLAARAVRKWYERTRYERCLDSDTLEKLEQYIFYGKN